MADLSKLSKEELQAMLAQKKAAQAQPEPSVTDQALEYGGKGIDAVLRALDYTSGLGRGAAGGAVQAYTGKDLGVNLADVLKGKAPTTSEMMQKGDVLSDSPMLREGVGLAGDVLLDPATFLTLGGSALTKIPKAAKVANAMTKAGQTIQKFDIAGNLLGKGIGAAGEKVYSSAFKNIDSRLAEKGQEPIAPYMRQLGATGSMKELENVMENRIKDLGEKRAGLYKGMEDAGITIDPNAASQHAYDYVKQVRENPYLAPKADQMVDYLSLAKEPMSVSKASNIKTSLYDSLPDSAFNPNSGQLTNQGKELLKNLSKGYKEEIEKGAEFFKPGMGQQMTDINKEMGAFLGAAKPTKSEIAKAERGNLLTQVKSAVMSSDPKMAAAMYGAQALNSPMARTNLGKLMYLAKETAPAEELWKQLLLAPTNRGRGLGE